MKSNQFFIAQVGKTVGLWGDLKIHFHTDFPEQFEVGKHFDSSRGSLEIIAIDFNRSLVRFRGYEGVDIAKKLTNAKIYTSLEDTKANCKLDEGQHFWFDIMDSMLYDGEELLGKVVDIQRILDLDYLQVETSAKLIEAGLAKSFLVPYIERYIERVDSKLKSIYTHDTKDILEAS